jgi:hypothetical protein
MSWVGRQRRLKLAKPTDDPGWFREELRRRDREIAELRQEQREADDLVRRLRERAEDCKSDKSGPAAEVGVN